MPRYTWNAAEELGWALLGIAGGGVTAGLLTWQQLLAPEPVPLAVLIGILSVLRLGLGALLAWATTRS